MNSIQYAQNLLSEIGWASPLDFTLPEIANYLNINVREVPIFGSQGRILINNNSAIITINSDLTHEGKKNFVIAHEIGHFLMHKHIISVFSDTQSTLSEWLFIILINCSDKSNLSCHSQSPTKILSQAISK